MRSEVEVLLLLVLCCSSSTEPREQSTEPRYHRHAASELYMEELRTKFPHLVRTYPIGHSENNLTLRVVEVMAPPLTHETPHEEPQPPQRRSVRLVGSVFGDEPAGREMLLRLARLLASSYPPGPTPPARPLHVLDVLHVHVLPALNVDGAEVSRPACFNGAGRYNIEGVSLDLSFPPLGKTKNEGTCSKNATETAAVLKWIRKVPAVLALTMRGGLYVVAYPYETRVNRSVPEERPAPDKDVLRFLARTYADLNPNINNGTDCNGKNFKKSQGVVNSAAWRSGRCGLQDYSYSTGSMHLTVGLTCCRHPRAAELDALWEHNREALLALLAQACGGLDGVVRDAETRKPLAEVRLVVQGREGGVFYSARVTGTFARILLPGNYTLEASKTGYCSASVPVRVATERRLHVEGRQFLTHVGHTEVLLHRSSNKAPCRQQLADKLTAAERPALGRSLSPSPAVTSPPPQEPDPTSQDTSVGSNPPTHFTPVPHKSEASLLRAAVSATILMAAVLVCAYV